MVLALWLGGAPMAAAQKGFSIEREGTNLTIRHNGKLFTRYIVDDSNKPYLFPVIGPTGKPMTRAYPMKTIEGEQHDHPHHRGIWFGHQGVDGFDTWHERKTGEERKFKGKKLDEFMNGLGATVHRKYVKTEADAGKAVVVVGNDYTDSKGKRLLSDTRTMTFRVKGDRRIIDFDMVFHADAGKVTLEDQKDAGFSIRVPSSMSVTGKPGGHIRNSEGDTDKDAWGKRAAWVDYYGPVGGELLGIAILNHPDSFRHPTPWHVRTYGLFTANPFGTRSLDKSAPDGSVTLKKGDTLKLRHRVILHPGDFKAAAIGEAFEAYAKE